uniref:Uncharacterized protein n=1 Tax=Solanum lycopersicum TaxID=4081 RepID=A0A3Q7JC51_SOLLC
MAIESSELLDKAQKAEGFRPKVHVIDTMLEVAGYSFSLSISDMMERVDITRITLHLGSPDL